MTMNNKPLKGWVRKEGVKFEVACALNGINLKILKTSTKVPIADPLGNGGNLVCQCIRRILEGSLGTGDIIGIWRFSSKSLKCADKAI